MGSIENSPLQFSGLIDNFEKSKIVSEMHRILSENMDIIRTLCLKHHIKTLYAFGSVCTDRFNDSSDIDLLVSFFKMDYADNYFDTAEEFEDII